MRGNYANRYCRWLILTVVCAGGIVCPGVADVIHLKNGKVLEGIIINEKPDRIAIELAVGQILLSPSQIRSIDYESDAEDQLRLGKTLLKVGKTEEAEACFQKAAQIDSSLPGLAPTLDDTQSELYLKSIESEIASIESLVENNQYTKAIKAYEILIEQPQPEGAKNTLRRKLAELHADFAFFLYDHLYRDRALEEIRKAQALVGDFAQLHFILGRLSEATNYFEDAIWEYQETLRQDPNHSKAKAALDRLRSRYPGLFKKPVPPPERPPVPAPVTQPRIAPKPRPETRPPTDIASAIGHYASLAGFDPNFIETIIRIESSFNPKAVSEADCRGLMQLGKAAWNDTVRRLGKNWDYNTYAYDPIKNIEVGTEYLRWMRDDYFPRYENELASVPVEQRLIQGFHSGPWRTVVYRGQVPGPRMDQYRERFSEYRKGAGIR